MWTCDIPDEPLTLTLNFSAPVHLSALVIWNYNGSIENLDCGVNLIFIKTIYFFFFYSKL